MYICSYTINYLLPLRMLETLSNCPVCSHDKYQKHVVAYDHTVSHQAFTIVQCNRCRFKFTNPRPDVQNIGKYYQSEDYISHSDTKKGIINFLYHQVRDINLGRKLKLVNGLAPEKRTLLDVGCGTGYFAKTCQNDGWQVAAVEPDPNARQQAENRTGLSIAHDFLNHDFGSQQFGIITMWHVLEHVHALTETIQKLRDLLTDKGSLVIAVPNADFADAKRYKQDWAAYDVPRHLYHFTPETMQKLVDQNEMKLVVQEGMPFDAYYISMMSEKYKYGGGLRLPLAFLQGLQSNRKARQSGHYSSMIYVIKKI